MGNILFVKDVHPHVQKPVQKLGFVNAVELREATGSALDPSSYVCSGFLLFSKLS